ncbi:MAG: hypothetical protein ACE366_31840 [Bradymonadia bacterium]
MRITSLSFALLAPLALIACDDGEDSENTGGAGAAVAGAGGEAAGGAGGEAPGGSGGEAGGGAAGAGGQVAGGAGGEAPGGAGGDTGGAGGEPAMCMDITVYADSDGDGFGVEDDTTDACLLPDEELEGYAREASDCAVDDAWRYPGAIEICGDRVDDDCDGNDAECPTTNPAGLDMPSWDCVNGEPPANVYAWAHFPEGNEYFQANACFVFFEGLPGEFYVERVNFNRTNNDPSCEEINGCTCPSLNGWAAFDRRMYAFTRQDVADESCDEVWIMDHAGEEQAVSSSCRKYLYQMHFYDIDISYIAGSMDDLNARLDSFPIVEVACAEDRPHRNLPFQSLMRTTIEFSPSFNAK